MTGMMMALSFLAFAADPAPAPPTAAIYVHYKAAPPALHIHPGDSPEVHVYAPNAGPVIVHLSPVAAAAPAQPAAAPQPAEMPKVSKGPTEEQKRAALRAALAVKKVPVSKP